MTFGAGDDEVAVFVLEEPNTLRDMVEQVRGLHELVLGGARTVVVDVSAVQALSSTAIAGLLAANRLCRSRKGEVIVCGPSRQVQQQLDRTGLSAVLATESEVPAHVMTGSMPHHGRGREIEATRDPMPTTREEILDDIAARLVEELGPDLDLYSVRQLVRRTRRDLEGSATGRADARALEQRARQLLRELLQPVEAGSPATRRPLSAAGRATKVVARILADVEPDLDPFVVAEVVQQCEWDLRKQVPEESLPELVERCARARLQEAIAAARSESLRRLG